MMNALEHLADLLDACEPEDDAPVTWGSLRRQVRAAADQAEAASPATGGLVDKNLHYLDPEISEGLVERVADTFGEWLFRMHGVTSSCDHKAEARGILAELATFSSPVGFRGKRGEWVVPVRRHGILYAVSVVAPSGADAIRLAEDVVDADGVEQWPVFAWPAR